MPLFMKILTIAIHEFPLVNSSFVQKSAGEGEVNVHRQHNISVAFDSPIGLIVPHVKDCQSKSILEIAEELHTLQSLANEGKLTENELQGGTICFTNIGAIGGTYCKPCILPPQSSIVALGRARKVLSKDEATGE